MRTSSILTPRETSLTHVLNYFEDEHYNPAADSRELKNLFEDPAHQARIIEMKLMLLKSCLKVEDKTPKNIAVGFWTDTFSDRSDKASTRSGRGKQPRGEEEWKR